VNAAVIVAAGRGTRMGGPVPKVLLPLRGRPCLWYAVRAFCEAGFEQVVLVTPQGQEEAYAAACAPYAVQAVAGGDTRTASVWQGLQAVDPQADHVAIHDGARPCITAAQILQVLEAAQQEGGAVAGTPARDTLQQVDAAGLVCATPDRSRLWAVQTPQTFAYGPLMAAYAQAIAEGTVYTDDVAVARAYGMTVRPVDTGAGNLKVTGPEDLAMVEARLDALYGARMLRVGTGYDVHRLVEGRRLILCGVDIPFEKGLLGHSDADVATHAAMDALLGAAAMGDIGRLFPDNDPAYAGADSLVLMQRVCAAMAERGFTPAQVDVTIVCQRPKLLPYREQMRANLAAAMGLPVDRVSVKATTTEKMGFEGRGDGISAQAVATVWSQEA